MTIKDEQVACVTDLHIGAHQNDARWHKITIEFAGWFKKQLKERGIKDIIICGDVNNNREEVSVQSLHVANEVFTMWKDFNIIMLVGNHDAYYKNRADVNSLSPFSGWQNITIVEDITEYNTFGKKLIFCPWGCENKINSKCDYLFGHFEINGFNISKIKVCENGINSTDLLKYSKMIISGHFHFKEDRKYKNGRILYIGSPYELNWGDCGSEPRGFYYLNIPTGEYEFVKNTISPQYKKIRMSEITSAGKITDDIAKIFPGNFVNFIVDQDIEDTIQISKISDFITTLSNKFKPISIKTEYTLENRISVEDTGYEFTAVDIPTSIQEFVKMTDIENQDEVLNETLSLYQSCNKED